MQNVSNCIVVFGAKKEISETYGNIYSAGTMRVAFSAELNLADKNEDIRESL